MRVLKSESRCPWPMKKTRLELETIKFRTPSRSIPASGCEIGKMEAGHVPPILTSASTPSVRAELHVAIGIKYIVWLTAEKC